MKLQKNYLRDYPDLDSFLNITNDELEERIKQIGLYRNKAKNLIIMFNQLKG